MVIMMEEQLDSSPASSITFLCGSVSQRASVETCRSETCPSESGSEVLSQETCDADESVVTEHVTAAALKLDGCELLRWSCVITTDTGHLRDRAEVGLLPGVW